MAALPEQAQPFAHATAGASEATSHCQFCGATSVARRLEVRVPTLLGLAGAFERAGLMPVAIEFDSSPLQFNVSEGNRAGQPLVEQRARAGCRVTGEAQRLFSEKTGVANLFCLGDQAVFFCVAAGR